MAPGPREADARSILADHRTAVLIRELDRLLTTGNREGHEWMCGIRSFRDILADAHPDLDVDQFLTQPAHDITRMPADQSLLRDLHSVRMELVVSLLLGTPCRGIPGSDLDKVVRPCVQDRRPVVSIGSSRVA